MYLHGCYMGMVLSVQHIHGGPYMLNIHITPLQKPSERSFIKPWRKIHKAKSVGKSFSNVHSIGYWILILIRSEVDLWWASMNPSLVLAIVMSIHPRTVEYRSPPPIQKHAFIDTSSHTAPDRCKKYDDVLQICCTIYLEITCSTMPVLGFKLQRVA